MSRLPNNVHWEQEPDQRQHFSDGWPSNVCWTLVPNMVRRLTRCRFPLFSKGVDTYRFEYAVFLLNKDIEMVSLV